MSSINFKYDIRNQKQLVKVLNELIETRCRRALKIMRNLWIDIKKMLTIVEVSNIYLLMIAVLRCHIIPNTWSRIKWNCRYPMRRVVISVQAFWMNIGIDKAHRKVVILLITKDLVLQKGDNQITKDQAQAQKRDQKPQIKIR